MPAVRPTTSPSGALRLDRRRLLRGGLAGAAAAALAGNGVACSSESNTTTEGVDMGPDQRLEALFPRDVAYLPAEVPFRLPYTFIDAEGVPFAEIDGPVTFTVSFDGEQVGDPVEVAPHGLGVPRPYLPLPFTFPRPGLYDVEAVGPDGPPVASQVQAVLRDEVEQPVVGAPMPPTRTPTVTQSLEVDPICTRSEQCPFHEIDLMAALESNRPVAVLLATPAYCRTTACGPILDLLIEEAGGRDELIVIHSEVYKNPKGVRDLSEAALAPLPTDWSMPFEPALFVTDAAHEIVARGDIVVDRTEMAEMLDRAVA